MNHGSASDASHARFYWRKVVRDLLWAITSPHMIDPSLYAMFPVEFAVESVAQSSEWLLALQANPTHLVHFLQEKTKSKAKSLALGVYFAALLEYWLRFCPFFRVEKFAIGKQIVSSIGQTLGQLKFLFRFDYPTLQAPEDYHIECSVKFFLLHPIHHQIAQHQANANEINEIQEHYPLEQFVGPHLGENLAWRVQEVERKVDMCRGESVQAWLTQHYSGQVQSHVVLRGYLFYPLRFFESTSQVNHMHDWMFHQNQSSRSSDATDKRFQRHHPSISSNHLRGWWTSDIAAEFRPKILANDHETIGSSRFAVLPKLHWLSPVIGTQDQVSEIVHVDGEDECGIESVRTMSLDELEAFAAHHFSSLASTEATQAKGGVVMPLLVAELVVCRAGVDAEFSEDCIRWKEISRGFILDPASWDPRPLCQDAVRYRRTNNDESGATEREYEKRKAWTHDGMIKPTDQELEHANALRQARRAHVFACEVDDNDCRPDELCTELIGLMTMTVSLSHGVLKQSLQRVLRKAAEKISIWQFVLQCLNFLTEDPDHQEDTKTLQRVGHLLLDAVEAMDAVPSSAFVEDFIDLFHSIAACSASKWSYLNLILRAMAVVQRQTGRTACDTDQLARIRVCITQLLEVRVPRWNAIAIETIRVMAGTKPSVLQLPETMVHDLMDQQDWKNAEQLVLLLANDPTEVHTKMLTQLYEQLVKLNMTKAVKRVRRALLASVPSKTQPHHPICRHYNGPAIDHHKNRTLVDDSVDADATVRFTYVDTIEHIDAVMQVLQDLATSTLDWSQLIVGMDCEWRPQFLLTKDLAPSSSSKTENDDDENENEEVVGEHEGLSLYQLAIGAQVYVVDVQVLGAVASRPLHVIWAPSSPFILTGFCVRGDLQRLHHSFPTLLTSNDPKLLVELKQLALYRQVPASKWGLSQLYATCCGHQLDKEQQCSDWGLRPLSSKQLVYAATDAMVVHRIAVHLLVDLDIPDLAVFLQQFAVVTNPQVLGLDHSFGQWISHIEPLGPEHVQDALDRWGLRSQAPFLEIGSWTGPPEHPMGTIVKTIALMVRSSAEYLAVVLRLDGSIDLMALGRVVGVSDQDLVLVDKETLIRVFGYTRGAVGPIGLREQDQIQIILDHKLMDYSSILCGGGAPDVVYAIAPSTVQQCTNAMVAGITQQIENV